MVNHSRYLGYQNLLFQVIGPNRITKSNVNKKISTKYPKSKHWWSSLRRKPGYYKAYGGKIRKKHWWISLKRIPYYYKNYKK